MPNTTVPAAAEGLPEIQSLWSRLDEVEILVYEARSLSQAIFMAAASLRTDACDAIQTCVSDLQDRLDKATVGINDLMADAKKGGAV